MENVGFETIIGSCGGMMKVYEEIQRVSELEIPVLITGESGTGKDLVAQTIHRLSKRENGPFVPVNMGAISQDLIESELFGHERGAFTGAAKRQEGKFEQAKNGTLFLDEVTTMEQKVQVSLLRVLESNMFQRVGGSDFIDTDARIISATNDDVRNAVEKKSFREDLYYRLNVFNIEMPPLRTRGEDVLLLAQEFLKKYALEFKKEVHGFTSSAECKIMDYPWPGNVRELENIIVKAVIMSAGNEVDEEFIPDEKNNPEDSRFLGIEVGITLEEVERQIIEETLKTVLGNKTEAAKVLGISRKALYNKLHHFGLADYLT
jgi:DNA-binding NtrC family response regulator